MIQYHRRHVVLAGIGAQIWTLRPWMNLAPGSRGTPPQAFTWRKVTPARWGTPPRLTRQLSPVGYPTSHVNTVKEKREIIIMERLGTSPSRGTSPTWGSPLPCKQALKQLVNLSSAAGSYGQTEVTENTRWLFHEFNFLWTVVPKIGSFPRVKYNKVLFWD